MYLPAWAPGKSLTPALGMTPAKDTGTAKHRPPPAWYCCPREGEGGDSPTHTFWAGVWERGALLVAGKAGGQVLSPPFRKA